MSLFDKIKNQTTGTVGKAVANVGNAGAQKGSNKSVPVVFSTMPETLSEFRSLPQAEMKTPFETAAMLVAALCVYPLNKDESIAMINYLKGPTPLSNRELQFIADRMSQNNKAGFIGASYFNGATPQNDYTPSQPYTVTVSENPYSYDNQGYANLYIKSGGADSARPVNLRQAKDGKWYLWEQLLLADIRQPESTNPWA